MTCSSRQQILIVAQRELIDLAGEFGREQAGLDD